MNDVLVNIEIRLVKEDMYAMDYFDGPVVLKKSIAIDHLQDALIKKMSQGKVFDCRRMQAYIDQLEMYPGDPFVTLIPKK